DEVLHAPRAAERPCHSLLRVQRALSRRTRAAADAARDDGAGPGAGAEHRLAARHGRRGGVMTWVYPALMGAALATGVLVSRRTRRPLGLSRPQRLALGLAAFCGGMLG